MMVGSLAQLFQRMQVRRTVAATNTAPKEGVNPLPGVSNQLVKISK